MNKSDIDPARELIDAAWLRSDPSGITRHLADDAVLMPPNGPRQVGRHQINAWLREFFRHYSMTELAALERNVTVSGDMAFERTLYEWALRPVAGGTVVREQANWVGLWRKNQDGTWREVCGIWNSALPDPAAAHTVEPGLSPM